MKPSPGKQLTLKEWAEKKIVQNSRNVAKGSDPGDLKDIKSLRLQDMMTGCARMACEARRGPERNFLSKPGEGSYVGSDSWMVPRVAERSGKRRLVVPLLDLAVQRVLWLLL